MTKSLQNATPASLHWVLSYIASPGVVIPLLVLLILVIYYLISLSSSLRETVTDLRTQMRQERDAEREKTRQSKAANNGNGGNGANKGAAGIGAEEAMKATQLIAQWRKAVKLHPNQVVSQTLAREAVNKRLVTKTAAGVRVFAFERSRPNIPNY